MAFIQVLLFVLSTFFWNNVRSMSIDHAYCQDLKAQNILDMTSIMGMWYGAEVIPHMREEEVVTYDSCPIVHLAEVTYEMTTPDSTVRPGSYNYKWSNERYGHYDREYHQLRLIWNDSGNNIEYYLKYNATRKGFWMSSGPQNSARGSMLQPQYNQFAGTVQVLKAVSDHMVLTICQRLPEARLYSVILSREPGQLSRSDIHSLHNLLNRKDLSTAVVKHVCSGTETKYLSIHLFIFTILSAASYLKYNLL